MFPLFFAYFLTFFNIISFVFAPCASPVKTFQSIYEILFLFNKFLKACKTGIYYEDSPTQRVNYQVVNKLNKVEHSHPMLSLDKTKSIDEVKLFLGNNYKLYIFKNNSIYLIFNILIILSM